MDGQSFQIRLIVEGISLFRLTLQSQGLGICTCRLFEKTRSSSDKTLETGTDFWLEIRWAPGLCRERPKIGVGFDALPKVILKRREHMNRPVGSTCRW